MRYLLICVLFIQSSCPTPVDKSEGGVRQTKAERKPFQKGFATIKSPTTYLKRETEKGEYDPRPRVVIIDEKAGKYELRWIGYDGKQKVVKYQRWDAVEALVEAKIEKNKDGKFVYRYLVRNLPTSPIYFSGFIVQTLANDVRDESIPIANDIFTGHMANFIPDFSEGVWRHFAPRGESMPKIDPGKTVEFTLDSAGLPGIVGCRALGGDIALIGAGEHMPSELEWEIPGYDSLAKGYTIGPVDKLSKMNKAQRSKYVLENLPKFQEAGWMSLGTAEIYKSILEREDLAGALKQAKQDLEKKFITSEVFAIIEGLNQSTNLNK